MPADRFYLDQPLTSLLTIHGEELHHLHVMRIRSGEKIEIVNGRGELVEAQVERIDKKEATLKIVSHVKKPPPTQQIILAQALPRFSALEWVIEKGTELGVTEFWLFPGNLSRPLSKLRVRRFPGLFWPIFESNDGVNIRKLILTPSFDSKTRLKRTRKSTEP